MANISMSNPLPPPSITKVVQREAGKAASEIVAKSASANSNAPGMQKLEDDSSPNSPLTKLALDTSGLV